MGLFGRKLPKSEPIKYVLDWDKVKTFKDFKILLMYSGLFDGYIEEGSKHYFALYEYIKLRKD